MKRDPLLRTAESVVKYATRHGADAAEAFVERSSSGSVRVEKNKIGGIEGDATFGIGLRVVKSGRVGFAHLTREDDIASALKDALGAARLAIKLPKFGFATKGKLPTVRGTFDKKIAGLDGADLMDLTMGMVETARAKHKDINVTESGASYGSMKTAIANSEGLAYESEETSIAASCYVVLETGTKVSTGFASKESTQYKLDVNQLGAEAATLALDARNPKKLPKAVNLPVVVRPEPAADLLGTLTLPSLNGKSARRGESYYSGKVGKKVCHPKISIIDDPTRPRGLGSSAFDDEGEPSRAFAPIQNGVLKGFFFDRASAAEFKERPTGSALRIHPFDGRSYKSPPGISARNIYVEAPSTSTKKLIAGIDDGLLVHDLLGVHTANTVSGDFSVTSTVLFRIRKGAIEGPASTVSIAGNYHEILRKGIRLGDDVKQTGGESPIETPSMLLEDLSVIP